MLGQQVEQLETGIVDVVEVTDRHVDAMTEPDFIGSGAMNPILIGVSLFASLLSTITYLSIPGEIQGKGPVYLTNLIAFPLIFLFVGFVLLPVYMRQQVTSAYELLENRLGNADGPDADALRQRLARLRGALTWLDAEYDKYDSAACTVDQIIAKLRRADVLLGKGSKVPEVCKQLEITEQTYYRWRPSIRIASRSGPLPG